MVIEKGRDNRKGKDRRWDWMSIITSDFVTHWANRRQYTVVVIVF